MKNTKKQFSVDDILSNFNEYVTKHGFDFDDTMYNKLTTYINWLSSKID